MAKKKNKGKIIKIIGYISDEIISDFNLTCINKEIVQSLDLYIHTYKHLQDFESVDSYNNAITNLDLIIKEPYYVSYDNNKNSLLYYKEIDEFVCLVVKLMENKDHYSATIYPVTQQKVDARKDKDLLDKYKYKSEKVGVLK